MKLTITRGFDIDTMREANPRLKFILKRGHVYVVPKYAACPDCGEPMANGGACGYYCTAKGCYHDRFPKAKTVTLTPRKGSHA